MLAEPKRTARTQLRRIHITAPKLQWNASDWLSKRTTTWMNLRWFGRGRHFRHADAVMQALVRDLDERRPDAVPYNFRVFSIFEFTLFVHKVHLGHREDPSVRWGVKCLGRCRPDW